MAAKRQFVEKVGRAEKVPIASLKHSLAEGSQVAERTIAFEQIGAQVLAQVRAALVETDYDQLPLFARFALRQRRPVCRNGERWPVTLDRNDEASMYNTSGWIVSGSRNTMPKRFWAIGSKMRPSL
jgi:hypothetical protein